MAPKKGTKSQPETATGPHGFKPVEDSGALNAPVVDREYFKDGGIIARYIGARRVKRDGGGRQFRSEYSQLHNFQLPKSHGGARFAAWGTARLDRRMEAVKVGAIVHVEYRGLQEVAGFDNPVHDWLVSLTTGVPSPEVLADFEGRHAEVTRAAAASDAEFKRTRGAATAGEDTDDDLPF